LGCSHLQVHPGLQHINQYLNIAVLNMASVFPQVQGYSIGSCLFSHQGGLNWFRVNGSTGLAHCGYVVNIYSK